MKIMLFSFIGLAIFSVFFKDYEGARFFMLESVIVVVGANIIQAIKEKK